MNKLFLILSVTIILICIMITTSCVERPGFEIKESVEQLKSNILKDTNDLIVHYNLGLKYLSVANYDSALIEFNKTIDIYYQFSLGHFAIYCTELAKDTSLNIQQKNDSLEKIRKVKFKVAESHFDKAVYYDPFFDWTAYSVILEDISRMNRVEKAVYELLESGIRYFIIGDYDRAKKKLTRTYETFEDYYKVLYFRCLAHAKTNDFNSAISDLHTLIDKKQTKNTKELLTVYLETADYYFILGYISLKQDSLDKAEKYFKKALTEDMSIYMAHFHLSYIYQKKGKINEAISELDAAVLLDPKDPVMIYNKGVFLMELNKLNEAEECFKKSLELSKRMNKSYFNLALIYEAQGNKKLAIENYINFINYSSVKLANYINQARNKITILSN